jgi:hypothetical protein
VAEGRQRLSDHPIYRALDDQSKLRRFMELHVWAVYDFMALLGALRQAFARSGPRWTPPQHPAAARAVNEITLAEESDSNPAGGHCSHLELYLQAMAEVGADHRPMRQHLERVASGYSLSSALLWKGVPMAARIFSLTTVELTGSVPAAAAAFCYGRELLLPDIFDAILAHTEVDAPLWRDYLRRHVVLDSGIHGPYAREILCAACQNRMDWRVAVHSAQTSLAARLALWDAALSELNGT